MIDDLPTPKPHKDRTPEPKDLILGLLTRARDEILQLTHRDPQRAEFWLRNARLAQAIIEDVTEA